MHHCHRRSRRSTWRVPISAGVRHRRGLVCAPHVLTTTPPAVEEHWYPDICNIEHVGHRHSSDVMDTWCVSNLHSLNITFPQALVPHVQTCNES
eukprot:m.1122393 g.1122393  ORF g.1122393 m.1122393 type:complete len:94 (-) comp24402_c0_seq14:37-318(-)